MNCPYCGYYDSKVIDSREINDGIRRRRQCLKCDSRFTTYERLQPTGLFVIKKDERREEFNRDKLLAGIRKACEKRPLPSGAVENTADEIEAELYRSGKLEVPSTLIGDMVMERLKELDHIAYIRFASVYNDFQTISSFEQVVRDLRTEALLDEEEEALEAPQEEPKVEEQSSPTETTQLSFLPPDENRPKGSGRPRRRRS